MPATGLKMWDAGTLEKERSHEELYEDKSYESDWKRGKGGVEGEEVDRTQPPNVLHILKIISEINSLRKSLKTYH